MAGKSNVNEKLALEITDHISAMLAYWDKDQVCMYANAAYLQWFGKTRKEVVGKMTLKELLGPIYELNLPYINGALAGKPQSFERELAAPTGGRYSLTNYFPKTSGEAVEGFFIHITDITQVKLLERELLQSSETIKEQNKILLNFANIVTHNLKAYANNLAVILELFKGQTSVMDKNELMGFLKEISNGFLSTIKELTDISEVRNVNELRFEPVNLAQYIERAVRTVANEVISCRAVIRNNVNPNIKLLAIPSYIDSIILNLLTNAINFRQPGRQPVIELDAFYGKNELVFFIKDNGMGIDLCKHKADLFGVYKTFQGNTGGKGIGLFLVKSKVEAMGGHIEVESEVNVGTVFKIYFKLANLR